MQIINSIYLYRKMNNQRLHSATSRRTEHHSIRTIGKWSNSQNGYVLNPIGTSHCIAGEGNGHDTTMPRIILTEDE